MGRKEKNWEKSGKKNLKNWETDLNRVFIRPVHDIHEASIHCHNMDLLKM